MSRQDLTIVIPVFNSRRVLLTSVRSAACQERASDILIVDDGSDDEETVSSLEDLRAQGFRVLVHRENRGVGAAINTAVAESHTSLVMAMGADDRLRRNLSQVVVDTASAMPSVDIFCFHLGLFGEASGVQWTEGAPRGVTDLLFANRIPGCSVFRRDLWARIGGFREGLRWGEDWDFWLRAVSDGAQVYLVDEVLYDYRRHKGQLSDQAHEQLRASDLQVVLANQEIFIENIDFVMMKYWQDTALQRYLVRRLRSLSAYVSHSSSTKLMRNRVSRWISRSERLCRPLQ